jgi:very-short-patch-repair endonuclease
MQKGVRNYSQGARSQARGLRGAMTKSEKRLWYDALSENRMGFRFHRQYPVGPYTLDFFCPELALCIEVDGDSHEGREVRDAYRDRHLAELGIATYRVGGEAVMLTLGEVRYNIRVQCEARAKAKVPEPPPCPPPTSRGRLAPEATARAEDDLGERGDDQTGASPCLQGEGRVGVPELPTSTQKEEKKCSS